MSKIRRFDGIKNCKFKFNILIFILEYIAEKTLNIKILNIGNERLISETKYFFGMILFAQSDSLPVSQNKWI